MLKYKVNEKFIKTKFTGLIAVRLGIFDQLPKPGMALYGKERPHWNKAIDGVEEHEAMPKLTEHFKMWLQINGVSV